MQHTQTTTADGSSTLELTHFGETYHSRNGAYTEAMHIYIKNGLEHLFTLRGTEPLRINVFDVGFGTGLNCILSFVMQQQLLKQGLPYPEIHYYGIEKYPIPLQEIELLNYHTIIAEHSNFPPDKIFETIMRMHSCRWDEDVEISPGFTLHKSCADIAELTEDYYRRGCGASVVYYDTFSPATQPDLWDEKIFRAIAEGCNEGSLLLTYCSKGVVKQALRTAGFTLERLGGPPGKRHILRATLSRRSAATPL